MERNHPISNQHTTPMPNEGYSVNINGIVVDVLVSTENDYACVFTKKTLIRCLIWDKQEFCPIEMEMIKT